MFTPYYMNTGFGNLKAELNNILTINDLLNVINRLIPKL